MGQDGNMIQLQKLMFSKNRRRCPFNMANLVSYRNDPQASVFLMEGEKDCLNALAKGLRTVTLRSTGAKVEDMLRSRRSRSKRRKGRKTAANGHLYKYRDNRLGENI